VLVVFSLISVMWCVCVQWNVVYVNGPSHCKLELNIYNGFTRGYIVEANRLNVSLASKIFEALHACDDVQPYCSDRGTPHCFAICIPS
jgi:hypothetical protein